MSNWTKEQLDAINKSGSNIIVSAGAGSGKTSVLSERVITKLKSGININRLLILTFTNLAALEMKDRIRNEIMKHDELKENLLYLESAYITTFDSYTLSLVRKYHYLLNISPSVSIISESVMNIIKNDTIDEVFDELYKEDNPLFQKLIKDLTIKNDTQIKEAILEIIKKIDLISDKQSFLNNYLDTYLSSEKIDEYIKEYENLIKRDLLSIETNMIKIADSAYSDYYEKLESSLEKLIKSATYDEVRRNIYVSVPQRPRGSDEIKDAKKEIDDTIKRIKDYLRFDSTNEIKEIFEINKEYLKIILEIIRRFYIKVNHFKEMYDLYEFNDIEIMAIKLLKEHEEVRHELKNYYQEILVDEYQDTNDLQEEFINLISNNNVYMVGDIKQSIYGFRNANPEIFRSKYNKYSLNDGGIKIDLLANFRSRSEVINVINEVFSSIMDEEIGNANYRVDHQMQFGNTSYNENKMNESYELEILNYQNDTKEFKNREVEAFIIGRDIINKLQNNYQVYDKELKTLRKATYSDFCIIMDRGKSFSLYKKIFEYLGIPLTVYEDKLLTNETDIMLIANLIAFIVNVKNKTFNVDFTYEFLSIARSFLGNMTDQEIFKIIKDHTYKETIIYKKAQEIANHLDNIDNLTLINLILDKFNFYEQLITISNIEEVIIRIDNLTNIARDLSKMGYTVEEFANYLKKMINGKDEIRYSSTIGNNGVKIMNIHKSKGLEFSICYFASLDEKFNTDDLKKRYIFDLQYGIITPFFKDGLGVSILKDLYKDKYLINDISEKIRLFYVALTRAKEKIIIVTSLLDNVDTYRNLVDVSVRLKYNSLKSILDSIYYNLTKYIKNINLADLNISKNYLTNNINNVFSNNTNEVINYHDVKIESQEDSVLHASKEVTEILTLEEKENINLGLEIHKSFEQTDFFNISNDNPYQDKIKNLIKKLDIKNTDTLYKEHEFIFQDNDVTYHGIIDLIIKSDDCIKIVDYKLKNIDNPKYINQLQVYHKYLSSIYDKEIKMYLYSILTDEVKEILLEAV